MSVERNTNLQEAFDEKHAVEIMKALYK